MALSSGERKRFSSTVKVENGEYLTNLSQTTLVNQSKLIDLAIELLREEVGNDVAKLYALLQSRQ